MTTVTVASSRAERMSDLVSDILSPPLTLPVAALLIAAKQGSEQILVDVIFSALVSLVPLLVLRKLINSGTARLNDAGDLAPSRTTRWLLQRTLLLAIGFGALVFCTMLLAHVLHVAESFIEACLFILLVNVAPLVALYVLIEQGKASKDLEDPRHRLRAFQWVFAFSLLTLGLFMALDASQLMLIFCATHLFVTLVLFGVTCVWYGRHQRYGPKARAWKISIHGAGTGGLAAVALALFPSLGVVVAALVCVCAVGVARVVHGDHSPLQVLSGALTAGAMHAVALTVILSPLAMQ